MTTSFFVLSTFIFIPIQWINNYGWRKTTAIEGEALFCFFKEVSERMNIKNIPASLEAFENFVREYEIRNFIPVDTNHAVGNATVNIIKGWMSFFAKPFVLLVMKCLLDEKMLKALGYSSPFTGLKIMVKGAMTPHMSFCP
jgi:hypothetical protein